ncbi:hypothetical protein HETIRDRAFT_241657, partial [Heterobasidion irregulare TC 32-1]
LSDAIVVWRAWALWSGNRIITIGLICLLAVTASTLLSIFFTDVIHGSRVGGIVQRTSWLTAFMTNVVVTSLVAYKAWKHRQFIKSQFGSGSKRTNTEKILILLIESGVLYCLVWVSFISQGV